MIIEFNCRQSSGDAPYIHCGHGSTTWPLVVDSSYINLFIAGTAELRLWSCDAALHCGKGLPEGQRRAHKLRPTWRFLGTVPVRSVQWNAVSDRHYAKSARSSRSVLRYHRASMDYGCTFGASIVWRRLWEIHVLYTMNVSQKLRP